MEKQTSIWYLQDPRLAFDHKSEETHNCKYKRAFVGPRRTQPKMEHAFRDHYFGEQEATQVI